MKEFVGITLTQHSQNPCYASAVIIPLGKSEFKGNREIMRAVLLILLAFCFSCQDEAKPRLPDIKVAINDTSEIALSDSIYFITADTLPNVVTVISGVSNPNIYYSVNNLAAKLGTSEPIILQKQDTVFQFYLTKGGYDNSELKTVILQPHSEKFLDKVDISSPVSESNLTISMNDKSRGMVEIEIYNVTGQRLLHRSHLKNADSFMIEYALAEYPRGIYVVSATYGESQKVYKFIKT
ncbi:T9SS type A sorting domain-containing protein [Pontibacter beigongshangensis]|uniref:T9SS type A sorting domain-containing protein n=1 Tax=Pontibacter beigongshangensis TaxID=2574733 RepID=UPI00165057DC|nr:T9SS type A sorting domain-containing protein [Pontibacter beigongshangensis]